MPYGKKIALSAALPTFPQNLLDQRDALERTSPDSMRN